MRIGIIRGDASTFDALRKMARFFRDEREEVTNRMLTDDGPQMAILVHLSVVILFSPPDEERMERIKDRMRIVSGDAIPFAVSADPTTEDMDLILTHLRRIGQSS